jgi:hypothetical protein
VKSIRNLVVLFVVGLAAVAVNAQNALQGKFQLNSPARWGQAVLPAGEYTFFIESMEKPVRVMIHSVDGKTAAIAQARSSDDPAPGGSYLFITATGTDRVVRSMNLPQLGCSLVYRPLTRRERETLYVSESDTVPVVIARK